MIPPVHRSGDAAAIEANRQALLAALRRMRRLLERCIARQEGTATGDRSFEQGSPDIDPVSETETSGASALDALCSIFDLSAFERDTLLLCAGVELDAGFRPLCAAAQGDPRSVRPTWSLALAAFPDPHWSALSPERPLRRWKLIEAASGESLVYTPLKISERVLHYLTGVDHIDADLRGLVEQIGAPSELLPSERLLAERLAEVWIRGATMAPLAYVCGKGSGMKRSIAAAAAGLAGLRPYCLHASDIPVPAPERETLMRLWEREAVLSRCILMIDAQQIEHEMFERAVRPFVENLLVPVILAVAEPPQEINRPAVRFDVAPPEAGEQYALWRSVLGAAGAGLNGQLERLVAQFNLTAEGIRELGAEISPALLSGNTGEHSARLWESCRVRTRPRMQGNAQRIIPAACWDDLVLPEQQRRLLREIAAAVRQRFTVYEQWGFYRKSSRGLAVCALFCGGSGTGKTMAAEVLANELHLDLYRIDLSQVVNKYIGETEKNLSKVFDAAEDGGAILLFDEAEALFGKRSEVKDSHDRYANIEIGYLLQRIETYRGLAILTTNMRDALDQAFLRRIRFLAQFPFPDAAGRAEIWRRIFPPAAPTEGLDFARLAQLGVAGGTIRNIALYAAFLAADAGEPVRMSHIARAAAVEYAKLDRTVPEAEMKGWRE